MKTTVDELNTFIAIIDKGSISSAAEELHQTTSGISRTLSRLEGKLGVTLLRRTTRRLVLTAEGEGFLKHAREIIEAFEVAEESVKSKNKTPSGILRVDSASPFVIHSIAPYVEEFQKLYPQIQLQLYSNDRFIDLLEKRVDVAIRIGELKDSSLHAVLLGTTRRRIYGSPAYLKKHGTPKTVEELREHRLVGFTDPESLNRWPLKSKDGDVHSIVPHLSASSGETVLHLVRNGCGIGCLSDFVTGEDRKKGSLVQILNSSTTENKQFIHAVYYKNRQLSHRAQIFIDFLKAKMKAASN